MGLQKIIPLAIAATSVEAVQYSLQGAAIEANQPFSEAFVSYSIEFSSFPDFAGENHLPDVPMASTTSRSSGELNAHRKRLKPKHVL